MCKDCGCDKKQKGCCEKFEAILTRLQEVPLNNSKAYGRVKAVLVCNKLTLSGYFEELESRYDTELGSSIQLGHAGQTGAVELALTASLDCNELNGYFSDCDNVFELTDDQVSALKNRQLYINVVSEDLAAGELRGQLLPESYRYFIANLTGDNVVPDAVVTTARGTLLFELDSFDLTVSGYFDQLSDVLLPDADGVVAHIHYGPALTNGPVIFPLHVVADLDELGGTVLSGRNVYPLNCEQLKLLKEKDYYITVHTAANPAGEIRSQICKLKYVKPCTRELQY